jgi:cobalt-precorrin-5B (C1)-methyltransferase
MPYLRTGFATGAYAAATALAAWRCLDGKRNGKRIAVWFPDDRTRRVNVDGWRRAADGAVAWARKDAGDDVDITDGAVVRARLSRLPRAAVRSEDYREPCGAARLVLRGGAGVGRSTRPGLDVPPGKWAINPGPRRMIVRNLDRAGLGNAKGTWLVEISIDNGATLARKTLNPTLGVVGGLSVLGTSGIVVPCSNAAYISTIRVLLKGARQARCSSAVLVTGGRTHGAARRIYPGLPEVAFVRIGDFIREACDCAGAQGFRRVAVCCMPGKLAKYALGHAYTHAHHAELSVRRVLRLLARRGALDGAATQRLREARSIRECFDLMSARERTRSVAVLCSQARDVLAGWLPPGVAVEVRVLGFNGRTWRS